MSPSTRKQVLWLIHNWSVPDIALHLRVRDMKVNKVIRQWRQVI